MKNPVMDQIYRLGGLSMEEVETPPLTNPYMLNHTNNNNNNNNLRSEEAIPKVPQQQQQVTSNSTDIQLSSSPHLGLKQEPLSHGLLRTSQEQKCEGKRAASYGSRDDTQRAADRKSVV